MTKSGTIALLSGIFGFISPADGTPDSWFKMANVVGGAFLRVGDAVEYTPYDGPNGKPRARDVRKLDARAAVA
jgi:cold shock CspA family protein